MQAPIDDTSPSADHDRISRSRSEHASARAFHASALLDFPEIHAICDLAQIVGDALDTAGIALADDDVVVVAQKVVSKAEGRIVDLHDVTPSARAVELGREADKDPRFVELVLSESTRVVRVRRGVLIVEHRLGFIMANAGIDRSNVDPASGKEPVLLLPQDPDMSAATLHDRLTRRFGCRLGLVVNDSFGRPWRLGTTGVAIGAAGLPALIDMRGKPDRFGRRLLVTEIGFADEIAAAASLLMGQADEGSPVVLIRGLRWTAPANPAGALVRRAEEDLFR